MPPLNQFHTLLGAIALATALLAACASPAKVVPTVPGVRVDAADAPTPAIAQRSPQGRVSGFVPLDDPAFIPASTAAFLGDNELVLGYARDGEARAYPVSMIFWHHIINDTVQGQPLLVTY